MAAQEMILKLLFNDDGTFVGLEEINKELKKVDDSTTKVEESTKGLKQQYAELRKEQDKYDPGTEKFNELSVKMGELKDRMNDAADAVKANTGPAVEGLRNSFGLMGEQLSNLDFEGLTQSINLFAGNLGRINPTALASSFRAMFSAAVNGFKVLGNVIKQNPIFLLVGVLVSVIAYWKEISEFFSGKGAKIDGLNKQLAVIKEQESTLNRQKASAVALKANEGEILKLDINILENKKKQAEIALQLADLEGDAEKSNQARADLAQTELEIQTKLLKVRQDAEALINKILGAGSQDYERQVKQAQAFEEYKKSSEQLHGLQLLNNQKILALQEELQLAKDYEDISQQKFIKGQIESLKKENESLQIQKDAIWNAGELAKSKVKTDKELADEAERKAKADAAAKKLADDLLVIKKEMADWSRRNLSDLDKEIFLLNERQKLEVAAYEQAGKSAQEMSALLTFHKEEEQAIRDKYAQIEYDKQVEADKAIVEAFKEKYNAISEAAAEQAKANELRLLSEKDRELQINKDKYDALIAEADLRGVDTKVFLDAQLAEEDAIKKKWSDKEKADTIALQEMKVAAVAQGLQALTALNESFTARTEKTAKRQFNVNKALNIAMSLVDTYSAIVKALNSPETVPTSVKIAQAVAVGVMGFANVAKIAKTQFGGGAPNTSMDQSGGGANNTQANAPAVDFSGGNFNNNAPGTVETYVLAGNVANALEARQKIIDQSYL